MGLSTCPSPSTPSTVYSRIESKRSVCPSDSRANAPFSAPPAFRLIDTKFCRTGFTPVSSLGPKSSSARLRLQSVAHVMSTVSTPRPPKRHQLLTSCLLTSHADDISSLHSNVDTSRAAVPLQQRIKTSQRAACRDLMSLLKSHCVRLTSKELMLLRQTMVLPLCPLGK